MTRSGPNPVLAPIRRWVLYSRTNLALAVITFIGVLSLVGMVFGEGPQPRPAQDTAKTSAAGPAEDELTKGRLATGSVDYELKEASESEVVTKPATWVASSAPATAMAYAHAFVDTTLSDAEWIRAVGRFTADLPGETTVAARPRTPVVITGPTASKPVTGAAGAQSAQVTVPTQAGDLAVSVAVEDLSDGTQRWVVTSPLPTLDLSEVERVAPQAAPPTAAPQIPSPARQAPSSTPVPTSPRPPADGDESEAIPSRPADPVPVPGPIPIPELDTPIPGQL